MSATRSAEDSALRDRVPDDCPGAREIGFRMQQRYNASAILFDNLARERGSAIAVRSDAGSLSYAELCRRAAQAGHALLSLGLEPGQRVLLFLDDTPAYPAVLFGAIRAGLVPVLVNTLSPPDLVAFYLEDSGAAVAVVDAEFEAVFAELANRGTALRALIVVNGDGGSSASPAIADGDGWIATFPTALDAAATLRDDMAFWMYSSGSTGKPKGIVHLQHDMAYTAESYARHVLQLGPRDVCYSVPKIFFAYGLGNSLTFPFAVGASSVLTRGQPRPEKIFEQIARHRPTVFFGLPTLYTALAKSPAIAAADTSSLRLCISAAEVLAHEVFASWKSTTGLEIVEGLGSTEALHIYLSNTHEAKRPGAAGRRVPGYEVELRDPDGRPVADGQEGILRVRGHSSAPCYWNRPDKTADTMRDGWLYTGDRFVRDSDGFHFFRGRADDLIKVSGQWVYPLEVELCLANHPDVHECAVMGVELADRRMTLQAWVVPVADGAGGEEKVRELQDYVKSRLLPYKYPRRVRFLSELPKTGTGKIDRQALLRSAAADQAE
jgi:acetyl-CoA synthetase